MKLSVLQENLHKGIARVSRIISTKPQLPVLTNALLLATDEGFWVLSSSLETTEKTKINAKIEGTGGLCVPARAFAELVSSLPQEAVVLEEKEGALVVSCGGVHATVPGVAASEFPPTDSPKGKEKTAVKKDLLVRALSLVLFAAATDEGRPLLTGAKIVQKKEETTIAATDGYRLSVYRLPLGFADRTDAVIPARALAELARVCQEEKEEKKALFYRVVEGQLCVQVGDTEIITRQIDGQYPGYEKIIPSHFTTRATLDTQQLLRAVKTASLFARDSANIVRFRLDTHTLTVSANSPQVGEGAVQIDAKVEGDGGEIAFNSRFLAELLAVFPGEELVFEMTGALNPGAFRAPKDPAFLHIIMPVRVQAG